MIDGNSRNVPFWSCYMFIRIELMGIQDGHPQKDMA